MDRPGGLSYLACFSFSRCSRSTALRLSLILLPSSASTLTRIWSPSFNSSRTSRDAVFGDLADVQQAVGAGEDLDERAEIHQPHHLAQIGLADFGRGREVGDDLDRLVGRGFVGRSHVHGAVVFHVDLDAGLLDDPANHLAAWSNHVADLIGRNVQGVNSRRVLRHVGARLRQRLVHLVEDEQPAAARLLQRFLHDGGGHVGHLDIHLQSR